MKFTILNGWGALTYKSVTMKQACIVRAEREDGEVFSCVVCITKDEWTTLNRKELAKVRAEKVRVAKLCLEAEAAKTPLKAKK